MKLRCPKCKNREFYQSWYCHVLYDEKGNEKKVDENSWQAAEQTFYCNRCFSPAEEIEETQ